MQEKFRTRLCTFFAIEFRNMWIQIHLQIAKVGLKSHFHDLQVNMDQEIAKIDRQNVQSRVRTLLRAIDR